MSLECLRQVRVIDAIAQTDVTADVLLENGTLRAVAVDLSPPEGTRITDASGLIFGPGLIDLYSHSGEPGFEERETLVSLVRSAQAGGFAQVCLLPDSQPAIDNPALVTWLYQHSPTATGVALKPWGALTVGVQGKQLTELAELATSGIVGLTDGRSLPAWDLLRRALEYARPLGQPIALRTQDRALRGQGVVREGTMALRLGLPGDPSFSETAPLAALLELVAEIGTPVHCMQISTAQSVALIQAAKQRGLPITASTTWLHLVLTTATLASYDPNLRLDPPLGNPADQQALIQAVKTGVIDAIAVDHCPYTYEEKTVGFGEAPPGAIGLELALPMLWQGLVETGQLSGLELWRALSSGPAACLGQSLPGMQVGGPVNGILFDPKNVWTVQADALQSRSHNTHLLNQTISGRVIRAWF
jgi:dihydroorotase